MIEFDRQILNDFNCSTSREWLETNGIGGFAAGTLSGVNTRRYHGLLVAATVPPATRAVLLSKFEETLTIGNQKFELSANAYPNAIQPQGFRLLKSFRLAPFPTWVYKVGEFEIEKTVFMQHGENTVIVDYKLTAAANSGDESQSCVLELRPLIAFRDFHHLGNNQTNFNEDFEVSENSVALKPKQDLPALNFSYQNGKIEPSGFWYKNFEYAIERERGFDFTEDLFQPFIIKINLAANQSAAIVVSTEPRDARDAAKLRQAELERRQDIIKKSGLQGDFMETLVAASDQFIVARGMDKSVIAGYPWFGDWGRDTMIALPGLTLTTNRPEIARSILLEFSRYISDGMLPNRFPDTGEKPEYNTVDATLWYFEAIRAYVEKTADYDFVEKDLYPKLVEIINWHLRGTRYNIRVDTDGLLCAGDKTTQLTWMDAKHGDTAFTPRSGKAVEIQALWYNALCVIGELAEKFKDKSGAAQYQAMAEMAQISFVQTFWNKAEDCLFDCINGTRDGAVRPNQIFAASLVNSMLSLDQKRRVVRKVEAELLTPYGLRTLSPKDAQYARRYEGDGFTRDSRYHQGTAWAWLSGAFFTAYAHAFADEPDTKIKLRDWLKPFKQHLTEAGIGQISEIFDGDSPHTPRGCFAQAWSVAEILRVAAAYNISDL